LFFKCIVVLDRNMDDHSISIHRCILLSRMASNVQSYGVPKCVQRDRSTDSANRGHSSQKIGQHYLELSSLRCQYQSGVLVLVLVLVVVVVVVVLLLLSPPPPALHLFLPLPLHISLPLLFFFSSFSSFSFFTVSFFLFPFLSFPLSFFFFIFLRCQYQSGVVVLVILFLPPLPAALPLFLSLSISVPLLFFLLLFLLFPSSLFFFFFFLFSFFFSFYLSIFLSSSSSSSYAVSISRLIQITGLGYMPPAGMRCNDTGSSQTDMATDGRTRGRMSHSHSMSGTDSAPTQIRRPRPTVSKSGRLYRRRGNQKKRNTAMPDGVCH